MTGRRLAVGLVAFAALFGAALWWVQTRAFYEESEAVSIAMLRDEYPAIEWRQIDAPTSPLKMRACLRMAPETAGRLRDDLYEIADAEPLVAPGWFDCFDAERISRDLAEGPANGYRLGPSGFDGVDVYLALYPNGRGYVWRQLNEKYANQ